MVCFLAYIHERKTEENILLVKISYKYCSILAHFPKLQCTQTLKTLNTQEFVKTLKLLSLSLSLFKIEKRNLKEMEYIKSGWETLFI